MPFFPNFAIRELMAWYGSLAVLGILAAFAPWELGEKADPFASAPAGMRPEWYFLAVFHTLKLIPSRVWIFEGEVLGIVCISAAVVAWMFAPFWAQRLEAAGRQLWVTGIGVFLIAYLLVFSALGYWK